MKVWVVVIAALALGAALGWRLGPRPPAPLPAIVRDTLFLPMPQVLASAPSPRPSLVERIRTRAVAPELVAVGTVPVPADSAAIAPAASQKKEAKQEPAAEPSAPPRLPYHAGRFQDGRLELWLTRTDGSVLYQRHAVEPPFQWVTDSLQLHVREQRPGWRWLGKLPDCAGGAGVGALAAVVLGGDANAAVGAGVAGCGISLAF